MVALNVVIIFTSASGLDFVCCCCCSYYVVIIMLLLLLCYCYYYVIVIIMLLLLLLLRQTMFKDWLNKVHKCLMVREDNSAHGSVTRLNEGSRMNEGRKEDLRRSGCRCSYSPPFPPCLRFNFYNCLIINFM